MSTTVAVLAIAGALAATVIAFAVWLDVRRRRERGRRRVATLTAVAERIDAAVTSLAERPATGTAEHAPVRSGSDAVERSRAQRSRLSAAVVRATGDKDARTLAGVVQGVAHAEAYAVGPRSVALVLPGLGRADALGVLARIEAQCPSSGRAVELESSEDAVEFAARLLAGRAGSAPDGD